MFKIRNVIIDWDETITTRDTMGLVGKAAYLKPRNIPFWKWFFDQYHKDQEVHEGAFGSRNTLEDHFRYLGAMEGIEIASVTRVEKAGVFKGVTADDFAQTATEIEIRDGWDAFYQQCKARNVKLVILSVNWSSELIHHGLPRDHGLEILANHIEFDQDGRGTGMVSKSSKGGIRTAIDKLDRLKEIVSQNGGQTVYIGDSNTDLPCLCTYCLLIRQRLISSVRRRWSHYGHEFWT